MHRDPVRGRGSTPPAAVLAIPVFVAGIEIIGVLGGSTHGWSRRRHCTAATRCSLELPDWHNGLPAGRLGLSDIVFVGHYATYARRSACASSPARSAMAVGTVAGLVLKIAQNNALPELAFLGAGFFLPNIDRVWPCFAPRPEG